MADNELWGEEFAAASDEQRVVTEELLYHWYTRYEMICTTNGFWVAFKHMDPRIRDVAGQLDGLSRALLERSRTSTPRCSTSYLFDTFLNVARRICKRALRFGDFSPPEEREPSYVVSEASSSPCEV